MKSKIKTNKGFSLIELMATLVIVSILSIVTIVAINRYIDNSRKQKVVQNKQNVAMAAELYLQANRDLMPKMIGEISYIPLMDLRNSNYIKEDVTNDKGEDCMKESFVRVFKLSEEEYNYTTHLYCGTEKAPEEDDAPKPYLVDLEVEGGGSVKILFSKSEDVKKANFSFKLRGSQEDSTVGIYSYSYSILGRTNENNNYTEYYNSGTIDANKAPAIEFKSRAISSYVDLAGVTDIQIKVTALNEQGGFLSYETDTLAAGGSTEYEDTIAPICPDFNDKAGRQGEPTNMDDWVNKSKIGTDAYPRAISLKCEDGDGSGCKRESFTQSWPNENEYPLGTLFGKISLEDNAVVDSKGVIKEPNKTDCKILVLVDLQSPTVTINPVNPVKRGENAGMGIEYGGKTYDQTPVEVKDSSEPKRGNLEDTTLLIKSTNYKDIYNEYDETEGWLNEQNYPEGIEYQVEATDNIYIYGYKWEVNKPYLNVNSEEFEEVSIDNPGGYEWNRNQDETLRIDEEALIDQVRLNLDDTPGIPEESNRFSFTLRFVEEGARYGKLTVYDRAGNETQIMIYAYIDRTNPAIDEKEYEVNKYLFQQLNEWVEPILPPSDEPEGDPTLDPEAEPGEIDVPYDPGVNIEAGYDPSTDLNMNGINDGKEKPITPPQPESLGSVSLYGKDFGKLERSSTGCYKIGTKPEKGDNEIEPKDYLDDEVFATLEEYQSGLWSNEELVCGPKKAETMDNHYTNKDAEGNKTIVEIPNEISGWESVHILRFKQIGLDYSYELNDLTGDWDIYASPKYSYDINDEEYVQEYIIASSTSRESWPVIDEQGTHRLKWKNCDKAGNCSEYKLIENVKIDTIKPKCQTSKKYNEEKNSDGGTGPNHNGWLYDKQAVTVGKACLDSSRLDVKTYFGAMESLKKIVEHNEVGSGCRETSPTTDTFTYDQDIDTDKAGAGGIEEYGYVEDLAGNIGYCESGVTVKKDTKAPTCSTFISYYGKNSEEDVSIQYNQPNQNGWAWGDMTITAYKICNDLGKKSPYSESHVSSNCIRTDDYYNNVYVRAPSDYSGTAKLTESYYDPEEKYFYPRNGSAYTIDQDKDIDGFIGSEGMTCKWVKVQKPVIMGGVHIRDDQGVYQYYEEMVPYYEMSGGYVVDQAGNISLEECELGEAKKDSQEPVCASNAIAMNGEFKTGEYEKQWVGSNGIDGTEEYVKVVKGCDDKDTANYPGAKGPAKVQSGCIPYPEDETENYWLYGNVKNPGTDRITPGERKGGGATFEGPDATIESYAVKDLAGNPSMAACEPAEVNIDYTPPGCAIVTATKSAINKVEYNSKLGFYVPLTAANGGFRSILYRGIWTDNPIVVGARCTKDNVGGSGCDYRTILDMSYSVDDSNIERYASTVGAVYDRYITTGDWGTEMGDYQTKWYTHRYLDENGERVEEEVPLEHYYKFIGFDGSIYEKLYTTDLAGNVTSCDRTVKIRQDIEQPRVSCHYTGSYSVDDAEDSYITVVVDNLEDPKPGPSFTSVGIKYKDKEYDYQDTYESFTYSGQHLHPTAKHLHHIWDEISNSRIIISPYDFNTQEGWYQYDLDERLKANNLIVFPLTVVPLEENKMTYKVPMYCTDERRDYRVFIEALDIIGHPEIIECEGTPLSIPGCCDKTIGPDDCEDWEWELCTEPCLIPGIPAGVQKEVKRCKNQGYYNNGKECVVKYTRNENTPCNRHDCCAVTRTISRMYTQYTSNPCSWGYEKYTYYSDLPEVNYYLANHLLWDPIKCGTSNYYLAQVNRDRCDELNADVPGESYGHVTPTSTSCELYMYGYTKLVDIVELRPTDPVNCQITGAGAGHTDCGTEATAENSIRANVNRFAQPYNTETQGCKISVNWNSPKYDFNKRKELQNMTYVAVKCENPREGIYEYCLEYCGNYGKCVDGNSMYS